MNEHDEGVETKCGFKWPKFVVMGHRGSGMNMLQSSDNRMKSIKENSIRSFNSAAQFPIDFIEFDVQVSTIVFLLRLLLLCLFVFVSFLLCFLAFTIGERKKHLCR